LNVSSSQSLVWSAKNLRGFSSSTADAATYRVFGSYSQQDILQSAITIPISGILTANFFGADRQNPVTGGLLGVNGLAFYDVFDGTVFGPDNIQSFSFHAHHDLGSTLSLSIGQFDQPGNPNLNFPSAHILDIHITGQPFFLNCQADCIHTGIGAVSWVPGPTLGAGIPGLLLIIGGVLGWRRRSIAEKRPPKADWYAASRA
jgi:hypothetical protein